MSRVLFVVNQTRGLKPTQATTAMVGAAVAQGHEVLMASVGALEIGDPPLGSTVYAHPVTSPEKPLESIGQGSSVLIDSIDTILVRTNPARDPRLWRHLHTLTVLRQLQSRGIPVCNPPQALRALGDKVGLLELPPEARPKTCVVTHLRGVQRFVDTVGRSVLKPARGTHGTGVFIVEPDDPNLRTSAELLLAQGPLILQEWLPEAREGDVRLFLLDGELLTIDGVVAAVRRRPVGSELRSNVHLGARPEPAPLSDDLRHVARYVGPEMRRLGVRLVGLDCIGNRVVETNVYAPGGLPDISKFTGLDFVGAAVERLIAGPPADWDQDR